MVSARFDCYLYAYLHMMYYDFKFTFPSRWFMHLTTITTSHAGYLNGTSAPADTKTRVEPLPAVDHSAIMYAPFRKTFYTPCAELSGLGSAEVAKIRGEYI